MTISYGLSIIRIFDPPIEWTLYSIVIQKIPANRFYWNTTSIF